MLGLNQADPNPPVVNRPGFDEIATVRPSLGQQPGLGQPSLRQTSLGQPSLGQNNLRPSDLGQYGFNQPGQVRSALDSIPDRSFTGLQSFFEPEEPKKNGALRVLLLVVLLAALAGAGWWTYGYLDNTESRKPSTATATANNSATANSSAASEPQNAAPNDTSNKTPNGNLNIQPSATATAQNPPPSAAPSPPPASATAAAPETPSPNTANASPDNSAKDVEAETKPAPKSTPAIPKVALGDKSAPSRSHVTPSRIVKPSAAVATDSGTADFQKGEAYLYGRGVHENCDDAVKYLKSASAKSSAKAKSAFGTMYATGHCVARDLPTSYLWFAMALREDPNNQILEKDLSAIWNQMTPPERQLATRMKQ